MTSLPNGSSRRSPKSFANRTTRGNGQTSPQTPSTLGVCINWYIKILRRNAVFGIVYILVGFSLISTISLWSFLSYGDALKSRSVETRAAEQHSLDWHDIAGHLGNVDELFAIKPANQKETADKNSAQNDRPFFITKNNPHQVVCPELAIPGLIKLKDPDLNDLSMDQSELLVLGDQIKQTKNSTKEGNRRLEKYNLTNVRKPIMDSMSQLAVKIGNYSLFPGGHWKPTNCLPRWKVAIVIPYRNRSYHLPIVLKYLTPMLRRQLLEFAFYVVEQNNSLAFNRAMLMNVGFLESLNFSKWDCFIFHDVDHIPLSDFNYYGCSGMPRHFLSGADRWNYTLLYKTFFGAVTGFTERDIRTINGFPNVYWGWGGEDDEIMLRVKEAKLPYSRPQGPIGFYNVIKHHHQSAPKIKERMKIVYSFKKRHKTDGLSGLRYQKPHAEFHLLYTNILVDIQKLPYDYKTIPAPPAKQQWKDEKVQPGDKLKEAKKAVEHGNVNEKVQPQKRNIKAKPATEQKT